MKVSIVTVCRNSLGTLPDALESVSRQVLPHGVEVEHIVIDGASTDGTREFLAEYAKTHPVKFVSEPDRGLYDAMNKGILASTGDVVGILNSDDVLAADDVVARIAEAFDDSIDIVYGDVRFARGAALSGVDAMRGAGTLRYCSGRQFRKWMFRFGVFPAHPSTFVRRGAFERFGLYSLDYSICADFEMMLRLFVKHSLKAKYVGVCTTAMRAGGVSTKGIRANLEINRQDARALKAHGIFSCLPLIYLKYFGKVFGYVRRK